MMLRNLPEKSLEARRASRAMNFLAVIPLTRQRKPKPRTAYRASKVQQASQAMPTLVGLRMIYPLKRITEIWRVRPRILSEDLVLPLETI